MSAPHEEVLPPKISEILKDFLTAHAGRGITIHDMTHHFGDRAFGFLLLIFALICAIPLPIPGIHMFLSLPLFYLSFQQMMGRHEVWFPEKVSKYELPERALTDIGKKSVPRIEKFERLAKARMLWLTSPFFYRFFGAMVFYITAFLSIPLPLTNFVPAIGIALIAIGILMKDGLALVVGTVTGVVWSLMWFALVLIVGINGLQLFFSKVVNLFI